MNELFLTWALKKMKVDQEWSVKNDHSELDLLFHLAKIGQITIYNHCTGKITRGLTPAFTSGLRLVISDLSSIFITGNILKITWQGGSEGHFITDDNSVYSFQFSEMSYPKFLNIIKNYYE